MIIRGIVTALGPILTFVGVGFGAWGTFLLTKAYHPFDFINFVVHVSKVVVLYLFRKTEETGRKTDLATMLSKRENRRKSLIGVYFIFVGFLLQALGSLFWGADVFWTILEKGRGTFIH